MRSSNPYGRPGRTIVRDRAERESQHSQRQKQTDSRENFAGFFDTGKATTRREKERTQKYVTERDEEVNTARIKKDKKDKKFVPGDFSEGVPPVPIPNTAVKPFSADGTWP